MSTSMVKRGKEIKAMRENNTIITVRLADNGIDRDYERFSVSALHDMAKLYAGKNGIIGEDINGKTQWGRILSCEVRTNPNKLTRSGEIYTYLEARVIIPRTNENDKLLNELMNKTQEGSISCSVRNRVCSLCGETDCTKHKKGTLYHGQLVEKVLNDIIDVYEWAIVKPCDNETTEDNSKDRRIKPSQLKPTRHPPMPDTTSPKTTMPEVIDFNGLFDSKKRYEIFKRNDIQMFVPQGRMKFIAKDKGQLNSPNFQSIYVCHKLLCKQIEFADIKF